jgi:hypothetical protein
MLIAYQLLLQPESVSYPAETPFALGTTSPRLWLPVVKSNLANKRAFGQYSIYLQYSTVPE